MVKNGTLTEGGAKSVDFGRGWRLKRWGRGGGAEKLWILRAGPGRRSQQSGERRPQFGRATRLGFWARNFRDRRKQLRGIRSANTTRRARW